jgi:hypothetical protein
MISTVCWSSWKIDYPVLNTSVLKKSMHIRSGAWLVIIILFLFCGSLQAQQIESVPADTINVPDDHSPTRALLMSAVLPSAGQAYNKKYWKMPVLYAGFTACGYFIYLNNSRYQTYRHAYILRADGDSTTIDKYTNVYSENNLLELKDYYRRNRDLTIIITVGVYVLNILDAYVDAHLFYFDVNDNLSLRVTPDWRLDERRNNYAGLKLNFSIH